MYLNELHKQWTMARMAFDPGSRPLSWRVLWRLRRFLQTEKMVRFNGRIVINSFLPPFPSPAFSRLLEGIRGLQAGTVTPVSAYLAVTTRCHFHCWHCSKSGRVEQELSTAAWKRALAEAQALGVGIIGFTGGEPLLRPDLEELVAAVDERSVTLLFTTGDGLTAARAATLKQSGLFGVAISLDHTDASEHDRKRGRPGAFRMALEAVRQAKAAGLYTMLQHVSTPESVRDGIMERLVALAKNLGVHEIRLLEPMPTGKLFACPKSTLLDRRERERLRQWHLLTNRRPALPKVSAFAQIEDARQYGCGAGFQHLYIDAGGHVCPCDFTPISFGTVQSEGLRAAWDKMRQAFASPRPCCFLLQEAERLNRLAPATLPIPYEQVAAICQSAPDQPLPDYYRAIGWAKPTTRPAAPGAAELLKLAPQMG